MRPATLRVALVATLILGAIGLLAWRTHIDESPAPARLEWLATASQLGPVGYRDPAGAISPDGHLIAYSEGRFLRVRSSDGGPVTDFLPGDGQVRHLAWRPDGRAILADGDTAHNLWAVFDVASRTRHPLFDGRETLEGRSESGARMSTRVRQLRQPVWSPDGASLAALVSGNEGPELWVVPASGAEGRVTRLKHVASFPQWRTTGGSAQLACVSEIDGRRYVTLPCDGPPLRVRPDLDVYGPIAFAPDGATVYAGIPNASGTLDLWSLPAAGGSASRLTSFSRDSYAPSTTGDGTVLFKVQSYRTAIAVANAEGGPSLPLALFRSETPSWDPTGRWLGITYGTWRRVVDDAKYPDIAQEAGIIGVSVERPAEAPARVVEASVSEDQSLCWSPNGKWIAYHSHKDGSDDIWMRPADRNEPGRRISFLGRGAETGWPRWSPDGRWLLFDGASRTTRRSAMFVAGVDQESGAVSVQPHEVAVIGVDAEISHAEWLPDSARVIVLAKESAGHQVVFTAPREGGAVHIVHRIETEHDAPGLAISPDGRDVAFIAPAADGFFQVWRMPVAGGTPRPVTSDRSHKTQPTWSPDGRLIAFTVWSYDVQFLRMRAPQRGR